MSPFVDRPDNDPARYYDGYNKLRSWAYNSLDQYKVCYIKRGFWFTFTALVVHLNALCFAAFTDVLRHVAAISTLFSNLACYSWVIFMFLLLKMIMPACGWCTMLPGSWLNACLLALDVAFMKWSLFYGMSLHCRAPSKKQKPLT